jgi:hypothetical protein
MFFCSPLWLISASAAALKASTAEVVMDNAMTRVSPLLNGFIVPPLRN